MNATFVYEIIVEHQNVAEVMNRFSAIDLSDDIEAIRPPVSVCLDETVDTGGGVLQRTVKLQYSAEFEAAYPDYLTKKRAVTRVGRNILNAQLPASVKVVESYEDDNCP